MPGCSWEKQSETVFDGSIRQAFKRFKYLFLLFMAHSCACILHGQYKFPGFISHVQSYRTAFRKLDGIAQQIVADLYQPVAVTHQNDVAASGNAQGQVFGFSPWFKFCLKYFNHIFSGGRGQRLPVLSRCQAGKSSAGYSAYPSFYLPPALCFGYILFFCSHFQSVPEVPRNR